MAEIMARHEILAKEYVHILISYMSEEANFLEHELLQRGVVWGVGRLAQVRPKLVQSQNAVLYLESYLDSKDATVRGLAVRAMGLLGGEASRREIERFLNDNNDITIYLNDKLVRCRVSDLAKDALWGLHPKESV
jgi:HEAT repeat protein